MSDKNSGNAKEAFIPVTTLVMVAGSDDRHRVTVSQDGTAIATNEPGQTGHVVGATIYVGP